MSVDYTTTTGYGFRISEEGIEKVKSEMDQDVETVHEHLDRNIMPPLELVAAGSYMDGRVEYAISIKRLTNHYAQYENLEGFTGFEDRVITVDEDNALYKAQIKYLSEDSPVGEFAGGLIS